MTTGCDHRNQSWWYEDGYICCSCGEQLEPSQIDAINRMGSGIEKVIHYRYAPDPHRHLTLCQEDEGQLRTTWSEELITCRECEDLYRGLALVGFLKYADQELCDLWQFIFAEYY